MSTTPTTAMQLQRLRQEMRELREASDEQQRELAALRELVEGLAVPLGRLLSGEQHLDKMRWCLDWRSRGGLAWTSRSNAMHDWIGRMGMAAVVDLPLDDSGVHP